MEFCVRHSSLIIIVVGVMNIRFSEEGYSTTNVYTNLSLPSSYTHQVESVSCVCLFKIGSIVQSRYIDHMCTSLYL